MLDGGSLKSEISQATVAVDDRMWHRSRALLNAMRICIHWTQQSKFMCNSDADGPSSKLLKKHFILLWREMQAVHELVAHAIQPNIGGVDLMKHKLVLVVHKVLCGALHVAEQLQKAG